MVYHNDADPRFCLKEKKKLFAMLMCNMKVLFSINVDYITSFFFWTDSFNRTAIAVLTACFICFAIFIVVLILLKMARLHRRKKKQSLDINSGREEMAMLHYRQKSFRSGNNNEEDMD